MSHRSLRSVASGDYVSRLLELMNIFGTYLPSRSKEMEPIWPPL